MRIVLDCRSVFPGMGGIGRVAANLARELPRALPQDQVFLLLGARRPEPPLASAPNVQEVSCDAGMIDPVFEQIQLPGILDDLSADLFHGTCFAVPIATGVKRVASVYDVVFRRMPELTDLWLREYLDRWTGVACELADAVVTCSEFSRGEISELYGLPGERIDLVPCAVEESFFEIERRPPPGAPFLLYAGALEAKKNPGALLQSFAALLRRAPSLPHALVLVGGSGAASFDVEAAIGELPSAVARRVHVLGHVPEEQLRALLGSASAFCYLSEYEGFGLPPLEAMAAGVPSVVSDRASLPEVTRGAALVVDPADPAAVADAMHRVLTDEQLRRDLAWQGREVARSYSWSASARQLAQLYRSVLTVEGVA